MGRSKKTVMIILCVAIFIMVVGFAAFSTTLTITGTANVTSEWNVVFTDIDIVSKTNGVSIIENAEVDGTSATFYVGLEVPGDEIIYVITVENQGTLDAVVQNINATSSDNPAIDFEVSDIQIGDVLDKKTSTTFNVTISFNRSITSSPSNKSSALTLNIDYAQALVPETPPVPTMPIIEKLQNDIDNASSDANIDFGAISSDTNGNGMYYTSTNTQDNKIVYYYRGAVENNYVQFGKTNRCMYNNEPVIYSKYTSFNGTNYPNQEQCLSTNVCDVKDLLKNSPIGYAMNYRYVVGLDQQKCSSVGGTFFKNENATYGLIDILWRIVRVNEDGSIRLITNNYVKESNFNVPVNYIYDNSLLGYMYGTKGATGDNAYELTHTNTHDSTIKEYLDDWYQNETNLYVYNNLMSTTAGFCNDRSIATTANTWHRNDTALGYGNNTTYYGAYNRLINQSNPQFKCQNESNDLFTMVDSGIGNEKLTNPVGLLTMDEVIYAGGTYHGTNESYYLDVDDDNTDWWTLSPLSFSSSFYNITMCVVIPDGSMSGTVIEVEAGMRPVINILPSAGVLLDGTGSATNPYVIP